jgi:predicted small lipoprotein YifL
MRVPLTMAVILAVLAVPLAACGKKGPLEAPPAPSRTS